MPISLLSSTSIQQPEIIALGDESSTLTVGKKVTFRSPGTKIISKIRASLTTASTLGKPTFDVKVNGVSVFSTLLTIDINELTSVTASVSSVLSTTEVSDDAEVQVWITSNGNGATGAKVTIYWTEI